MSYRFAAFLLLALLAACGSLPRPFEGNPGATAQRLAQPPPARLAIPAPDAAFLARPAATTLAGTIAEGLVNLEVPAVAESARKGDWQLAVGIELRDRAMVPTYRVLDPKGDQHGIAEGLPVPADEWTRADPATLRRVGAEAVPRIAALLSRIEAARRQSDPNSLLNRAPKVVFSDVSGAPGDGNTALAATMKAELVKAGQQLQDPSLPNPDFRVAGTVAVVPTTPTMQRVEIQWIVTDAAGKEAGRVVQLNEIRRGLLDTYWGDVALVVAQEAAGGVRDVITNRIASQR